MKYKVGDLVLDKRWSNGDKLGYIKDVSDKAPFVTIVFFENPHIEHKHTIFYLEQNYEVVSNREIK